MLKFIHVPIIPESIGAVQGMRHQDLETIDGSGTTTESTTPWPDVPNPDVMVHNLNSSDNLNFNDLLTAIMSMYPPTDASLTPTAQSLVLHTRPTPDAQEHGHHLENLIAHPPTTLYVQEDCHHLEDLSKHPINNKLLMSYIDPINNRLLMSYFELISATSSIRMVQTSIQCPMTHTTAKMSAT